MPTGDRQRPLCGAYCKAGHLFSVANTLWDRGRRRCKTCVNERKRQHWNTIARPVVMESKQCVVRRLVETAQ